MTRIIRGVDVAAATLAAGIGHQQGPWRQFPRTADGIAALAGFCRHHKVGLPVMAATGGYEKLPFALLWAAGIPVAIVNPRAVRQFAQAMGLLEKTDRLDAGAIAWYAEVKAIIAQPPAAETQLRLTACVTRLRQLVAIRVAQGNQRRLVSDADPLWAALDAAFRAIEGVADRTVARLIAQLPEIGTLSGKAVAKLAGLAPIANDSGKHNGRRSVRGGRRGVRSALFVVAEGVRRYDPEFHAFAHRLKAAGKPAMLIRVALAHKLLTRLNAKARDVQNNLPCPA